MTTYKISYLVPEGNHPGGIVNSEDKPQEGSIFHVGDEAFEVREVVELMPPHGDFQYLHVTCVVLKE